MTPLIGTIGKEGIWNINTNGVMLLSNCVKHDHIITNTLFRQKSNLRHLGGITAPNSGISLTMSLYEPGMAVKWTSQGPWLVQMTAGQIIASSKFYHPCSLKKHSSVQVQEKTGLVWWEWHQEWSFLLLAKWCYLQGQKAGSLRRQGRCPKTCKGANKF